MDKIISRTMGLDVSKLDEAQKQTVLSRLLGRLAHEIRNPLSSLDIHVQLLEEDLGEKAPELSKELEGRLEIIHGEIRQLEKTVSQFVQLSGPTNLDLSPVILDDLMTHVCKLLRPEAQKQKVEIALEVEASLPTIEADATQLTQALINLVINAVQAASKPGAVEVSARLCDDGAHVEIVVADDGKGIPDEAISLIFEPFFSGRGEGTGIGLWIARQVAAAHQGELLAQNRHSGGAQLTLRLPIAHAISHSG